MSNSHPIGWSDTSCPSGSGYQIMTEHGLKRFDLDERAEFMAEQERVNQYLKDNANQN